MDTLFQLDQYEWASYLTRVNERHSQLAIQLPLVAYRADGNGLTTETRPVQSEINKQQM